MSGPRLNINFGESDEANVARIMREQVAQDHQSRRDQEARDYAAAYASAEEIRRGGIVESILEKLEQALRDAIDALQGARSEMDAKVAAERERCAKVADAQFAWCDNTAVQIANGSPDAYCGYSQACEDIATRIRSGE